MINMTASELDELRRLLKFIESLKFIAPTGFDVYDSLGQRLGSITTLDHEAWAFETDGDPED